jgi:hypothetical protein
MAETNRPKNTEYLKKRLEELGVSEKQNTFTREWINEVSDKVGGKTVVKKYPEKRDYQIFDADEEGNIVIRYFNLDGQPYRWKKEDTKQSRDYIRKRLRNPDSDFKYYQEPGSPQFPFFNPGIIRKYKLATAVPPEEHPAQTKIFDEKEKGKKKPRAKKKVEPAPDQDLGTIETLFVVEGEFKSFKGWMSGLDIIGLPSIHGFYNGDVKGKLHDDIQEVIVKCKVKKIVFLVDADLISIKWAEDKDLYKRPASFYGSIKAFRESLQLLIEDDNMPLNMVYFMAIKQKFMNDAKGLDDLLCKYTAVHMEIIEDLFEFQFAKKYFDGYIINDLNKDVQGKMHKVLGLTDEQEFYKTYKDFIGAREFKFKRRRYVYDQEAKEVKFVRHEDADKFMRIGPDWVKVISKPNKYGDLEEEIVPWKKSEIISDYKRFPDFMEQCQRYDGFCNEPNWNGEYKSVVNGCFNVCRPLKWQPKEGSIATTIGFLKHIFQGAGQVHLDDQGRYEKEDPIKGDQFTVALDYLTIQLRYPKQMLPVPILVSPENGTGKSTFLKWLQMIYGTNMCILGNAQFQMKFNSHYITKYIISIDEGFLEVDKKAEKERLKQLVTADRAFLEFKGMNVKEIAYYGKLIICSNDADRVMKIEEGESRWFVVRVPVLTSKDPDLEVKLKSECEAWLHYLYNRQIFHQRVDRLWFSPEDFITEQFKVIVEATKNRIDRVFEDWLKEQFMLYRLPVLRYSLKNLTEIFNDPKNSKYKIDATELKSFLKDKLHMKQEDSVQRFSYPIGYSQADDDPRFQPEIKYFKDTGRPFVFTADKWISPEEMISWDKPVGEDKTMIEKKVLDEKEQQRKNEEIFRKAQEVKQMQQNKDGVQLDIGSKGYPEEWDNGKSV